MINPIQCLANMKALFREVKLRKQANFNEEMKKLEEYANQSRQLLESCREDTSRPAIAQAIDDLIGPKPKDEETTEQQAPIENVAPEPTEVAEPIPEEEEKPKKGAKK